MWPRAVTSDCSVGPNRHRHAVPEVLGNTAFCPREPCLSGKEATQQFSAIAYDLCNLRRLPDRYRNINRSVAGECSEKIGEEHGGTRKTELAIVGGEDLSQRLFGSMS